MRRGDEPVAVLSLALACTLVFVRETNTATGDFENAYALIPYDVTHGIALAPPSPPWPALTLVTSLFEHASWSHLIGNLVVFALAGVPVERILGAGRFLAFYLTCGVLGSLAAVAADPTSHVPIVGASGAIAGVLGAFVVLMPLARTGPGGLVVPALLILAWTAVQFDHGFGAVALGDPAAPAPSGIAYFAHIGGFLAGVITIGLFARAEPPVVRGRRAR